MSRHKIAAFHRVIFSLVIMTSATQVRALSLNEYLDQVKGQSTSYKGTSEAAEGAGLESREADLIFTPKLFAQAQVGHDGAPPTPPMKLYDRIKTQSYELGVSEQFDFGLQTKLYYDLLKTDFDNPSSYIGSQTSYWDAKPKLELTMPLWGGGFGRTAQANEVITRQQDYATQFQNQGQSVSFLSNAEATYWKVSAWQDVVRIQETALKSAQSILDYVSKKKRMNLGEEADVVQARALVESRNLELQVARNEQAQAQRDFNKYLNKNANDNVESLEAVNYAALENITVPTTRPGDRYDVKATEAQLITAKASSQLVKERNKPTLDVFGNYAITGRDTAANDAIKDANSIDTDTAYIGVRFNMPLNFGATSDAKSGALKSERAAEYNAQFARYSQDQDWADLTRNLTDARDNLRLLTRIEAAQKTKLDVERTRLRQGRTTTYQVLLFEQDYSQAAVSKVKSAANILGLQAQFKLYQASPEGGK